MNKRIVIADDTAYMRAHLGEILSTAGMVLVGEAENGSGAIALYRQKQPDLLLMNVVMPQMNGLEALKQIKAWDPHAKVILCSAMGQAPTVFNAIKAGASDFIVKPFEPKQIMEAIQRVLENSETPSQATEFPS